MRERAAKRHDRLLNLVRERGTVRVCDLADRLGVATVTARRDVEAPASRTTWHAWPGSDARNAP
ncbi:DeoR family transcriptional regulator, partial [Streptomyces sindenensis]|uniref:DeoR family transcriptional regulator n=1 Tax=Streptomyces sindenensis TaxID=67363 RepID=UPI0036A03395